jgi:hypothetical protein
MMMLDSAFALMSSGFLCCITCKTDGPKVVESSKHDYTFKTRRTLKATLATLATAAR